MYTFLQLCFRIAENPVHCVYHHTEHGATMPISSSSPNLFMADTARIEPTMACAIKEGLATIYLCVLTFGFVGKYFSI